MTGQSAGARLLAMSDLHVRYPENRVVVDMLRPVGDSDWLLIAGDVAEYAADVRWALSVLSSRFAQVVWVPGNHELWTPPNDPVQLRGDRRYRYLVEMCRELGVLTPEDPYPVWDGDGGPIRLAPLFLLYDYTFRPADTATKREALAVAYEAGVICTDESMLHPEPYEGMDDWCRARVAATAERLAECDDDVPLLLMNHFPLVRQPTRILRYPEFALWCGTELTADWHTRFNTAAAVYGHLHIPRTTWYDGVRFEEVSLGYPREWQRRPVRPPALRQIFPA